MARKLLILASREPIPDRLLETGIVIVSGTETDLKAVSLQWDDSAGKDTSIQVSFPELQSCKLLMDPSLR